MGNYRQIAEEFNNICQSSFEEYSKAEREYRQAEKKNGERYDGDPISQAKAARAKADYLEKQDAFNKARRALREGKTSEIMALRNRLAKAIADNNLATPEQVDERAITLLQSGILKYDEYAHLLNGYIKEGNTTMARLLRQAIEKQADTEQSAGNPDNARAYRALAYQARQMDDEHLLNTFDSLCEIYERTANNPSMFSYWDRLTAAGFEEF